MVKISMTLLMALLFSSVSLASPSTERSPNSELAPIEKSPAFAERIGWKTDGGGVILRDGQGIQFGLTTPKLFGFTYEGQEIYYAIGGFIENTTFVDGKFHSENNEWMDSNARTLGLVLEKRSPVLEKLAQPYLRLGAVLIKPDADVFDEDHLWGTYLALGLDVLALSKFPMIIGTGHMTVSYFAEVSGVFGVGRASNESSTQTVSKDIYNGFRPMLGLRFHL